MHVKSDRQDWFDVYIYIGWYPLKEMTGGGQMTHIATHVQVN